MPRAEPSVLLLAKVSLRGADEGAGLAYRAWTLRERGPGAAASTRPRPQTVASSVPYTGCLRRSIVQRYVLVADGGALVKADSSGGQVDLMHNVLVPRAGCISTTVSTAREV